MLNISEWEQAFSEIPRANLLQSYAYARAFCGLQRHSARWGVIEMDGKRAGLVQMLETSALGLHVWMIDRGPLWLEGFGKPLHFKAFTEELTRQLPRRFGRRRRFIPEIADTADIRQFLQDGGFKRQATPGYQTAWLDLRLTEDILLQNLNPKWRNKLRKGQKSGLTVEWDFSGRHFPWLLQIYAQDKNQRKYDGPSVKLLQALAQTFTPGQNMIIGRALTDHKPCAAILLLCHGRAATYQVGWSSPEGRDMAAHTLLLWDALQILKNRGIQDFDLGGVNDSDAAGVKQFKQGMGGDLVALPGLYT